MWILDVSRILLFLYFCSSYLKLRKISDSLNLKVGKKLLKVWWSEYFALTMVLLPKCLIPITILRHRKVNILSPRTTLLNKKNRSLFISSEKIVHVSILFFHFLSSVYKFSSSLFLSVTCEYIPLVGVPQGFSLRQWRRLRWFCAVVVVLIVGRTA